MSGFTLKTNVGKTATIKSSIGLLFLRQVLREYHQTNPQSKERLKGSRQVFFQDISHLKVLKSFYNEKNWVSFFISFPSNYGRLFAESDDDWLPVKRSKIMCQFSWKQLWRAKICHLVNKFKTSDVRNA